MISAISVGASTPVYTNAAVVTTPAQSASSLPPPLIAVSDPTDALAMMMASLEKMSQSSMEQTERRLQVNRGKLDKALDKYLDQVKEALAAARKAASAKKKKKKGFFKKVVDGAAKVCGKVVGAQVDFMKDALEAPIEIGRDVGKNITNPASFARIMQGQLEELSTNGEAAESVEGFTRGVVNFTADTVTFQVGLIESLVEGGPRGDSAKAILKEQAIGLYDSLTDNILANEQFWDVAEPLAKAAMVAGTVASGGALGFVAVGVLLLLEADNRTGFLDDAVGEDKAPFVRVGLAAGAAVAAGPGASGDLGTAIRVMQGGTKVLKGAAAIQQTIATHAERNREADDMDRQAATTETLNRMQRLQRMMDELVEGMEEQGKDRTTTSSIGNDVMQERAASYQAVVMRA